MSKPGTFQAGPDPRRNAGGRPKQDINVTELCRAQTEASVRLLVRARDSEDVAWSIRCHAAEVLINRAWGTPRQAVEVLGDGVQFVIALPEISATAAEWEQEAAKLNDRKV